MYALSIATTIDDLEWSWTSIHWYFQCYACYDQTDEVRPLESHGFRYKAAMYVRYLHIKFVDEIKGGPFEF